MVEKLFTFCGTAHLLACKICVLFLLLALLPGSLGKPRLVLHIGPHKTGTTAIQDVMEYETSMLNSSNWRLIDFRKYIDVDVSTTFERLYEHDRERRAIILSFGDFLAESLEDPKMLSKAYSSLADKAEANNYHYVMCHEDMHVIGRRHENYLSSLAAATRRFEVTIVYTYRESQSLCISSYNAHPTRLKHESLISYMKNTYSHQTEALRWKSHFADVVVMDYYGILAANQGIERVFFCEIMEIKGFCDYDFTQHGTANSGSSKELVNKLAGVQRAFLENAADQCQKLPANAYTPMYFKTIEKAYEEAKSPAIPVKTTTPSKDSKKRSYEEMVDAFDQYGSMKYKNITANADALKKASTYDVDGPAILHDESFIKMFKGLLKEDAHPGHCREIRKFTDREIHEYD
jgi:hypothetical protein